jgi:hypothetical protein
MRLKQAFGILRSSVVQSTFKRLRGSRMLRVCSEALSEYRSYLITSPRLPRRGRQPTLGEFGPTLLGGYLELRNPIIRPKDC